MTSSPSTEKRVESILLELESKLRRALSDENSHGDVAGWASERSWELLEGELKDAEGPAARFLRDLLDDIEAQWEILISNALHGEGPAAAGKAAYPQELLKGWLAKAEAFRRQGNP